MPNILGKSHRLHAVSKLVCAVFEWKSAPKLACFRQFAAELFGKTLELFLKLVKSCDWAETLAGTDTFLLHIASVFIVHALGNPHRCFDKKFEVCLCEIQIKLDSFTQYVTNTVDTEANQHLFLNSSHSRDVSHLLGLHEFFNLHGIKS
jgi:hypothetical protein